MQAKLLVDSESSPEFLKNLIHGNSRKPSLSEVCRRSGISSKGFLSQALKGEKRLTTVTVRKLAKAFKLNKGLTDLFEGLVHLEKAQSKGDVSEWSRLKSEIEKIRIKVKSQKRIHTSDLSLSKNAQNLQARSIYLTFASLGGQNGATINEVTSRSGLAAAEVRKALQHLMNEGLVHQSADNYRVNFEEVEFRGLKGLPSIENAYETEIQNIEMNAKTLLNDSSSLCFFSAASIDANRMGDFKEKLRDLLLEFMGDVHEDEGSKVARLSCTLTYR